MNDGLRFLFDEEDDIGIENIKLDIVYLIINGEKF